MGRGEKRLAACRSSTHQERETKERKKRVQEASKVGRKRKEKKNIIIYWIFEVQSTANVISERHTIRPMTGESLTHSPSPITFTYNLHFHLSPSPITFIYPLTEMVAGAPQMTSHQVSFIFLCSQLPSGKWRTPRLSISWCCLLTSSPVCLVFFRLSLCLARWFYPDLINERHMSLPL